MEISGYFMIFLKALSIGRILPGLARYLDTTRMPVAYAAYVDAGSDRFYDDNLWLGIDLWGLLRQLGCWLRSSHSFKECVIAH